MAPRPHAGPELINQVLQAAMAVFSRAGFQQARMEDIALIAVYEGLTLLWAVDPAGVAIDAASESAVRLILGGLSTR